MQLIEILKQQRLALLEGAVIERLKLNRDIQLDESLLNGPLIYSPAGRKALAKLWTGYLSVALHYQRPMLLASPTWRLSRDRVAASAWADKDINSDAVAFGRAFRMGYLAGRPKHKQPILMGGLMACRGDAYKPEEALTADEAESYHSWQARRLAGAGPDYILATTLPQAKEAVGLARAIARASAEQEAGPPYLISFVIRPSGGLLDGTPLNKAMADLDADLTGLGLRLPVGYLVSCVYPKALSRALEKLGPQPRLIGLQANGADLSPEELEGAKEMKSEPPEKWAADFQNLLGVQALKLAGGCCGTDERHLAALCQIL